MYQTGLIPPRRGIAELYGMCLTLKNRDTVFQSGHSFIHCQAVSSGSGYTTSSTLGFVHLFNLNYSGGYVVASNYGFSLYLPNDQ